MTTVSPVTTRRPIIFIGSASESAHVAVALKRCFDSTAVKVRLWKNAFDLGKYTFEALQKSATNCDFAAFVFSPDDDLTIRGDTVKVMRGNVVFELGLFMSQLGQERTFVVKAEGTDVAHLSDLQGINYARYEEPENASKKDINAWANELCVATAEIEAAVERLGVLNQPVAIDASSSSVGASIVPSGASDLATALEVRTVLAAQDGRLNNVGDPRPGQLVVHSRHGLGTIITCDAPTVEQRVASVQFKTEINDVLCRDLFSPLATPS